MPHIPAERCLAGRDLTEPRLRDDGSVLVHAHDGGIDHPYRRIMTGSQCIHDPIPHASLSPTNEAIIASGVGTIGFRQIAPRSTGA